LIREGRELHVLDDIPPKGDEVQRSPGGFFKYGVGESFVSEREGPESFPWVIAGCAFFVRSVLREIVGDVKASILALHRDDEGREFPHETVVNGVTGSEAPFRERPA
jgi:hypothetical protein